MLQALGSPAVNPFAPTRMCLSLRVLLNILLSCASKRETTSSGGPYPKRGEVLTRKRRHTRVWRCLVSLDMQNGGETQKEPKSSPCFSCLETQQSIVRFPQGRLNPGGTTLDICIYGVIKQLEPSTKWAGFQCNPQKEMILPGRQKEPGRKGPGIDRSIDRSASWAMKARRGAEARRLHGSLYDWHIGARPWQTMAKPWESDGKAMGGGGGAMGKRMGNQWNMCESMRKQQDAQAPEFDLPHVKANSPV